ncbi:MULTISPECIES: YceH family protein [Gulbenkiania]|uniref:Uncharacterized conserved protein YceH, UPF0502 family n=2 Tax=Gulbenkiania TaxID=397456 RepID=A0A0K6GY16_9NEIS|nr:MULTISPECIES: YceH family protein [Gulbenkiania]TCW32810.1 hypothetical protein EV669_102109 [Gulbenkiania mobilis]CUA83622.1 Uncharacterized conserved protein YceH, UPF0502 family [Gulbenkiania indica]
MEERTLTLHEVRVLGVLIEKQALTPDTYPMTLNALVAGCNQLTNREPVLQLSETDVITALDGLMAQKLVGERQPGGSRVAKYEHRLPYVWNIDGARLAALAVLMLRGPQTAAEIRAKAGRLYGFSGIEEVETALTALADKYPPLVERMARQPGERGARWTHLLCGPGGCFAEYQPQEAIEVGLPGRVAALEAEVAALKTRLAALEAFLEQEG